MKDAPFPSLAADAGAYGNHDAPPHIHVGLNDEDRILGAGGHGRVAADIAGKNGYDSIAFLDDTKKTCGRYPVMGESARFSEYDCDFFVAIGNPQVRRRMQEMLLTAGNRSRR